jgi:hypothetical protein
MMSSYVYESALLHDVCLHVCYTMFAFLYDVCFTVKCLSICVMSSYVYVIFLMSEHLYAQ